MRIPNEPGGGAANIFSDLIRLQSEFHSRLAEETLRYFRRIQGSSVPAAPGTVMVPDGSVSLDAAGAPASSITLQIEIENLQRVHCMAAPMLSPLVEQSGTTWFPACEYELPALVAPGEVANLKLAFPVPQDLPVGIYRGALLLTGFRQGAVPVTVSVSASASETPAASKPTSSKRAASKSPTKEPKKRAKKGSRS